MCRVWRKPTKHVRTTAVSLDSSPAASRTGLRCLADDGFGLHGVFVVTDLILVAGLSFVPRNVATHALLVVTSVAAKDGHFVTSDMYLSRFTFDRHL